ncbi:pancreatic triacylglycerol lipase-like [Liolophura sinensis]|uniref:pancreatic triacylglycerol lipase-like n=1 Tax=Liolophura sinensis TaxID=3198878 RepID=UPI00315955AA
MARICWSQLVVYILTVQSVSFTCGFLLDNEQGLNSSALPGNTTGTEVPDYINKTVCYDKLGCFSNIPPFDNGASLLPLSPNELNTTFILITRSALDGEELDYLSDVSTTTSTFNPAKQTRIVAHGFTQNSSIYWMQNMKDAFLKRADENVILVDWGNGAAFPNYPQAVANVRMVGAQLYLLIKKLVKAGTTLHNVHCIGHSLGAHMCGHTGTLLEGKLRRITGLEVAGPEYENLDPVVRLDVTDAKFVDAVHSNAAPIFLGGLGMPEPVGHVDFYLNGGQTQPGCPSITSALGKLLESAGLQGRRDISCSHSRAHEVFVESIGTSCPYTAYPCKNSEDFENGKCTSCGRRGCSQLGLKSELHAARGKMYVDTLAAEPYCGYHYFVKLETNGTDTKGKVMIQLKGSRGDSQWMMATRYDDDTLTPEKPIRRAVISNKDVGVVRSVKIHYFQTHGFWFFGGKETWEWKEVEVVSGVTHKRVAVCSDGTALRDGVVIEKPADC